MDKFTLYIRQLDDKQQVIIPELLDAGATLGDQEGTAVFTAGDYHTAVGAAFLHLTTVSDICTSGAVIDTVKEWDLDAPRAF